MPTFDENQNKWDAELLASFSNGDRDAAMALTSRLAPIVFSQAFRMLGDRSEAEDVTQESLVRLWKAAPEWGAKRAKITTWLYRVTLNLCIDRLRKSNSNIGDVQEELVDRTPCAEINLQATERLQALQITEGLGKQWVALEKWSKNFELSGITSSLVGLSAY